MNRKQAIIAVIFVFVSIGGAAVVAALIDASHAAQAKKEADDAAARVQRGPYIEKSTAITNIEKVSTVVFPHELGQAFDQRCIVYTNAEIKSSAISCDGNHGLRLTTE